MRAPNIAGEAGVRLVDEISARLSAWSNLLDSLDIVVGRPSDQLAVNKSCAILRHLGVQGFSRNWIATGGLESWDGSGSASGRMPTGGARGSKLR